MQQGRRFFREKVFGIPGEPGEGFDNALVKFTGVCSHPDLWFNTLADKKLMPAGMLPVRLWQAADEIIMIQPEAVVAAAVKPAQRTSKFFGSIRTGRSGLQVFHQQPVAAKGNGFGDDQAGIGGRKKLKAFGFGFKHPCRGLLIPFQEQKLSVIHLQFAGAVDVASRNR